MDLLCSGIAYAFLRSFPTGQKKVDSRISCYLHYWEICSGDCKCETDGNVCEKFKEKLNKDMNYKGLGIVSLTLKELEVYNDNMH